MIYQTEAKDVLPGMIISAAGFSWKVKENIPAEGKRVHLTCDPVGEAPRAYCGSKLGFAANQQLTVCQFPRPAYRLEF